MNDADHAAIVATEAAREGRYSEDLGERARERQRNAGQSINNSWTTPVDSRGAAEGEFVGRVAFGGPVDYLDGDSHFYVGTEWHRGDGYVVYNWAADISACTYYRQPGKTRDLEKMRESVAGVRVFARPAGKLSDYQDEVLSDLAPEKLFPLETLRVPRAPGRAAIPVPPESTPKAAEPPRSPGGVTRTGPILVPATLPSTSQKPTSEMPIPGPALRTPDLLRRQLAAPKSVSMAAVLSTLQTDQYAAIAKPASESQFLQGHPGTGKTIIAAHRAAFMLNREAPPASRPRGQVLLLGPTEEYVAHVSAALARLIDDPHRYTVTSIPALLDELAGIPASPAPTRSVTYSDVSEDLARLVDEAFKRAKAATGGEARPTRDRVYDELVKFLVDPPEPALEAEWVTYLRDPKLPKTYAELRSSGISRFRGLLAYIGVLVGNKGDRIGHVIVDEAQDIHPIEWEVLGRLGNTGGWTVLGDLNQRRTDHTYSTWDNVANALALENEQGRAPVTVLERGYRSTAQIIRFANQLLSGKDRLLYSLQQDGENPKFSHVTTAAALVPKAVEEAVSLSAREGRRTTAIIGMDTEPIRRHLLKGGWKAEATDSSTWHRESASIRLLPPERARGLEFDGVVVVEPAAFPENVGRQGVLYTALTRANRYLTVVYNRALPGGMKTRT